MAANLHLDVAVGVARLTIDRLAKRNAFDLAMWEAFPRLVDAAMADPAVRVLVVAAAEPGAFCAGADIGEFATHAHDPDWRARNNAAIRTTQATLSRAAKPTIAAVDGDCIGGGCGIAIACDIRLATPRARFGITPAKLGLVYPLHDTKLLVDLVGPSCAKRMLFTARVFDAAEAFRIGLVDEVSDDLDAAVDSFTESVVALSPATQRAAKAIVRRILDGAVDDDANTAEQFDSGFTGADFAEGVAAFLARRPARFT